MDKEPNWAQLLRELYEEEIARIEIPGGGKSISKDDPLVGRNTGLSRTEAENAILYLRDAGLLVQGSGEYVLTNDGFAVAHERRIQERQEKQEYQRIEWQENLEEQRVRTQNKLNLAIAVLTLGLVFVNFIDVGVFVFAETGFSKWGFAIALFLNALITLSMVVVLWQRGLLNLDTESDTVRVSRESIQPQRDRMGIYQEEGK